MIMAQDFVSDTISPKSKNLTIDNFSNCYKIDIYRNKAYNYELQKCTFLLPDKFANMAFKNEVDKRYSEIISNWKNQYDKSDSIERKKDYLVISTRIDFISNNAINFVVIVNDFESGSNNTYDNYGNFIIINNKIEQLHIADLFKKDINLKNLNFCAKLENNKYNDTIVYHSVDSLIAEGEIFPYNFGFWSTSQGGHEEGSFIFTKDGIKLRFHPDKFSTDNSIEIYAGYVVPINILAPYMRKEIVEIIRNKKSTCP